MTTELPKQTTQSRRQFLQTLLLAPACTPLIAASQKPQTASVTTSTKSSGYQETEHIRRYYQTLD